MIILNLCTYLESCVENIKNNSKNCHRTMRVQTRCCSKTSDVMKGVDYLKKLQVINKPYATEVAQQG